MVTGKFSLCVGVSTPTDCVPYSVSKKQHLGFFCCFLLQKAKQAVFIVQTKNSASWGQQQSQPQRRRQSNSFGTLCEMKQRGLNRSCVQHKRQTGTWVTDNSEKTLPAPETLIFLTSGFLLKTNGLSIDFLCAFQEGPALNIRREATGVRI